MINKKKIAAAMMAGAMALGSFAGPVAAYDHHDSDNGSRSRNEFSYRSENNTRIDQHNSADFDNSISIRSNTGGNRSDDGWRSRSHSGDSNVSAHVGNFANMNYANTGGSNRNWNSDDWRKDRDTDKNDHDYDKDDNDHDKHDWKNHDDRDHDDDKDRHRDHDSSKDHDNDKHWDNGWSKDHDKHDGKDEDSDHQHEFHASMSGHEEVPGPGDTDGIGHFKSTASHENNTLCVEMHVQNIEPANAAHIHYGKKGEAGPVVVPLPTPDANGHASGCVNVESDLLWKITENPSHYYVNVHNNPFPNGAVRGQLN